MEEKQTLINKKAYVSSPGNVGFLDEAAAEPGAGEVLIRIKASLVCGSDLHIFRGKHPAVRLPVTIGHEFTGVVTAVGSEVKGFKEGDRVVTEPVITCGKCDACRRGDYGYCENISFTYRQGHGAFARYFTGLAEHIYHLPDSISYEKGALTEPLAVAVHAVKRAGVSLGEQVVIAGAGAVGIMIAAVCKRIGAREIIVSDYSQARLDMAKQMGADHTVNAARDNLCDRVKELSGGRGFDKAFECVGKESTFQQLLSCVKMNGLVTDVGIFEEPQIHMDASILVKKEIRIQGAQGYCWDFEDALQILEELPLERLITHHFSLEETKEALKTAADPGSGAIKVCVLPDQTS